MASPLAGAREIIDDNYKGLSVWTDTLYNRAFMRTGRKNFQDENNPTPEAAEAYKTIIAGAGTYTLVGDRHTGSEDMNRVPNGAGRPSTWEVSFEGDLPVMTREDFVVRFRQVD